MPIEIRELVIRAVVAEEAAAPAAPSEVPQAGEGREAIVADCLDELARLLRERDER